MSKKPELAGSTPNNVEANALLDDAAHDYLTERMTNKDLPNAILVVGVLRVVEAGGHNVNGDRVTKARIDHLEVAYTPKDEEDLAKTIKRLTKARTGATNVGALNPPVDTPLDGLAAVGSGDAADEVE